MPQTRRRCRRGTIRRSPYTRTTRKSGRIYVPASCIPNVGNPGKGLRSGEPGIGSLREGELAQFGYHDVAHKTVGQRHLALHRAVEKYGALSVFRKLNAVYIYTRNTAKASSRIFKADRDWVKAHYGVGA